jgi:hypothetical protein
MLTAKDCEEMCYGTPCFFVQLIISPEELLPAAYLVAGTDQTPPARWRLAPLVISSGYERVDNDHRTVPDGSSAERPIAPGEAGDQRWVDLIVGHRLRLRLRPRL